MKTFKEFLQESESVNISEKSLTEIPEGYDSLVIEGNFLCARNKLTSLKGSPKEVKGYFNCCCNKLTNLIGSPEKVGGYFSCSSNKLTSLKGIPEEIGGDFICGSNVESMETILFEVSPILHCNIEGNIQYVTRKDGKDKVSVILNKYKNNPKNLIKMLAELKKIDKRFC